MNPLQDQYSELLKLLRGYLQQEYEIKDKIFADSETYIYFRNNYASRKAVETVQSKPQPISQPSMVPPAVLTKAPMPSPQQSAPVPFVHKKEIQTKEVLLEEKENPATVPEPKKNQEQVIKLQPDSKKETLFALEIPSAVEKVDINEIRKILTEKCPSIRLIDTIPPDSEAKKKARNWEQERLTEILIIDDSPKNIPFLENIRFACEALGRNAKLIKSSDIEKALTLKTLRLIIAKNADMEASSELKKWHRNSLQHTRHMLGEVPLLLLADSSTYMAEPHLKSILWQSIKNVLCS